MRKLVLPAICLIAFVFTAFIIQPGKGVTKIGKSLYKVNPSASITKSDNDELLSLIGKVYKIKDLEKAGEMKLQGVEYESAKGFRRTIAVETTISKSRVSERVFIIRGDENSDAAVAQDENLSSMSNILAKYGN